MREPHRYLGFDLAGAKNQKTAVAVLEYYPKEHKTFLLDVHDRITTDQEHDGRRTGDEALLSLIDELKEGVNRIGVNVPLDLPPCMTCTRKTCPLPEKCSVPAVKWMRETTRKAARQNLKTLEFTPYTQRPVELWVRYHVMSELHPHERFEIDEALGGNKGPLTARMHFLKRHLDRQGLEITEAWPKLTIARLATPLGLTKRTVSTYRHLEQGAHARELILEAIADKLDVFVYERDVRKLAHNLPSFDAFICALTALLYDLDATVGAPHGFPTGAGWVDYPAPER